jgi:hypothetical protein
MLLMCKLYAGPLDDAKSENTTPVIRSQMRGIQNGYYKQRQVLHKSAYHGVSVAVLPLKYVLSRQGHYSP